jgi:hypothetical protein
MAAFLAPFAPSYYTLHPDLDAARWEADQDAQAERAEREEAERAERLEDLEYRFMRSLEAGQPLPTKVIGGDLDTLICEQIAQVEKVLRWAAQHRAAYPELRDLLQPLAEAWAREVESCAP